MANVKRIGILSGSFDPIHKGHIAFALQAAEAADLDMVYFAPEVCPRRKPHATHIGHRLAMIRLATRPYKNLGVLELPDKYFLFKTTLPKLEQKFPGCQIILLLGSDLFEHLIDWPRVHLFLNKVGLVVGVRGNYEVAQALGWAKVLPVQPNQLQVIDSVERQISSGNIREALAKGYTSPDIVPSVAKYARSHWLYHDISAAESNN